MRPFLLGAGRLPATALPPTAVIAVLLLLEVKVVVVLLSVGYR